MHACIAVPLLPLPGPFLKIILTSFFFFFCCSGDSALGLSLVAESGGYSSCSAPASHCGGFSDCRAQDLGLMGFSGFDTWLSIAAPGA